jgi:hypothetical protein
MARACGSLFYLEFLNNGSSSVVTPLVEATPLFNLLATFTIIYRIFLI